MSLEIDWRAWLPLLGTLIAVLAAMLLVRRMPAEREDASHPASGRFRRQISTVAITLVSMVAIILALPIDAGLRGQLLSLFGLALTAVIALSSATFASNAMAGLMLRSLGNFHAGDFIRVAEHFGRVSERGLLHTEIQTEDRDLVTLPNLYLITQPMRVVHASGTFVSCELSLGYDVPRNRVSDLLQQAAIATELTDPFVRIQNLGDFSVTYQVSGFLPDVKRMLSARSALRGHVLDALHAADIEIVSPNFMNQRVLDSQQRILPVATHARTPEDHGEAAEERIFDKAETAARKSELASERRALAEEMESLRDAADTEEGTHRDWELQRLERRIATIDGLLADDEDESGKDGREP